MDGKLHDIVKQYIRDQWINYRRALIGPQAREELLACAKLYFYEKETTNPKNTYIDSEKMMRHMHPVLADCNGDFPKIFLEGPREYKVILEHMNGSFLYQYDEIPDERIEQ